MSKGQPISPALMATKRAETAADHRPPGAPEKSVPAVPSVMGPGSTVAPTEMTGSQAVIRALEELGVTDVRFLDGHSDGWLEPDWELQHQIVRVLRKVRPQRVLCQSPQRILQRLQASHPDHLAAGEATVRALLTTGAQAVVVDLPGSNGEALVAALPAAAAAASGTATRPVPTASSSARPSPASAASRAIVGPSTSGANIPSPVVS